MKGYFKYTTQLISSNGRFHCSALSEHPLPYTVDPHIQEANLYVLESFSVWVLIFQSEWKGNY